MTCKHTIPVCRQTKQNDKRKKKRKKIKEKRKEIENNDFEYARERSISTTLLPFSDEKIYFVVFSYAK